jgi:hypothetical protein
LLATELLAVKWLGKEFQHAELYRLAGHGNVTISGCKDDRNLMTPLSEVGGENPGR